MKTHYNSENYGVSLIEVVVGVALLVVVFVGLFGMVRLSLSVINDGKARVGALALAQEKIEFVRSVAYSSVGVVGGSPNGILVASENVNYNNIAYTVTANVVYVDDPKDGLGGSDGNGVINDYKKVEIKASWNAKGKIKSVVLTTNVAPIGVEQ